MGVLSAWRWSHVLASSIVIGIPPFFRHLPVTGDSGEQSTAPLAINETATITIWFLVAVSAQLLERSFNTTSHIFPSITQKFLVALACASP
jgi:hypothetical protein